jgi:translation initiation factor 2 subunit 1
MEEFGDLYGAFEAAAEEGVDVLVERGVDETWAKAITEVAKKNISPPEVQINGYINLTSYAPNGVEIIRNALGSINDKNLSVQCVGAPKYRLTVVSSDYPTAEDILDKAAQKAIKLVEKAGGEGEFHRELE